MSTLFVGSLPWAVDDAQLAQLFAAHGDVQSARVIKDRDTDRSRGFGFVELVADDLAAVIRTMDGHEVGGRAIRVNEAEERKSGGGGNRGGNNRSGGYGRNRY